MNPIHPLSNCEVERIRHIPFFISLSPPPAASTSNLCHLSRPAPSFRQSYLPYILSPRSLTFLPVRFLLFQSQLLPSQQVTSTSPEPLSSSFLHCSHLYLLSPGGDQQGRKRVTPRLIPPRLPRGYIKRLTLNPAGTQKINGEDTQEPKKLNE